MKDKLILFIKLITVVFILLIGGCKSVDVNKNSEVNEMVGKWEANIVRADGYGTIDTRFELKMRRNNHCLERTSSSISGKLFQELKCTYTIRDDGRIWIEYENGQVLQVGFEGQQLVLYDKFPTLGHEPNLKFNRIK